LQKHGGVFSANAGRKTVGGNYWENRRMCHTVIHFEQWEIESFKIERRRRDDLLGGGLLSADRWIGIAGEESFVRWLKANKQKGWEWVATTDLKHPHDFTWGKLGIDVKVVVRSQPPQDKWMSNVRVVQALRHSEEGHALFVFGSFDITTNTCYLVGGRTLGRYVAHGKLYRVGDKLENKMSTQEDVYCNRISALEPLIGVQHYVGAGEAWWELDRQMARQRFSKDGYLKPEEIAL